MTEKKYYKLRARYQIKQAYYYSKGKHWLKNYYRAKQTKLDANWSLKKLKMFEKEHK